MPLLKSNKPFRFRSFAGREPTTKELREEIEEMYKYLESRIKELDAATEERILPLENP